MDKFSIYKHRVEKALKAYEQTCSLRDTASNGLRETIFREAAPFVKGYFTLAVIGKMSSGKSTFINALLGNHSLLPTAYEQTTCTLTEIEYGDKVQVQVEYGDGHSKLFPDTSELLQAAAIPEKYRHLPINFINKLIIADKSENDIVKGKDKLDEEQGENVDVNLLREYIRSHSRKNIPTKVFIKYPLPESYRGWKIIDTPGVSALGGIERETRDFLNGSNEFGYNNVDAIVFVTSGRYPIEDAQFKEFVHQTFLHLAPEAKRRIFMIVTCGADNQFMRNRETYMETAKRIFVDGYKIRPERLICVDSICSLFLKHAKTCGVPITSLTYEDVPKDWDDKVWELCIDTKILLKGALEKMRREVNDESLIKLFDEVSGFGHLRSRMDTFITEEKSLAFVRLMEDINKDVTSILNDICKKKNILEASIGEQSLDVLRSKMQSEKQKLEESKKNFNAALIKVSNDYSQKSLNSRFEKYKTEMLVLRGWTSIKDIQLEAENIIREVINTKSIILDELSKTLEKLWNNSYYDADIILPQIDFKTIASKAVANNTYTTGGELIGYNKKLKERKGIGGEIKRFFGSIFGQKSWGYDEVDDYNKPIYSPTSTYTDEAKATKEFANNLYTYFSSGLGLFVDSIFKHIRSIGDDAKKEAENQVKLQQNSYTELEKRTLTLEGQKNTIADFDSKINKLQNILTDINILSHD